MIKYQICECPKIDKLYLETDKCNTIKYAKYYCVLNASKLGILPLRTN